MREHRNRPAGNGAAPRSRGGDKAKGTPHSAADRFAFRAEVLAEVALTTGKPAVDDREGLIAVPDLVLAQGFANGLPVPATIRLERPDGRSVSLYRWPLPAREVQL